MDFNKVGVEYQIAMPTFATLPGGGMSDQAMQKYLALRSCVSNAYRLKSRNDEILNNIYGCMHHFEAFLHQMDRFHSHVDAIHRISDLQVSLDYPTAVISAKPAKNDAASESFLQLAPPLVIGLVARNVEYDFVLLLLAAVATLDRISAFISQEVFGKEMNFYSLRLKIENSTDQRATKVTHAIKKALPAIEHLLITTDQSRKSLRNRLAHLTSIPEMLDGVLTIHVLEDRRSIVFDHDLAGFPLFASAHSISHALPYLSMSMMSAMLAFGAEGAPLNGTDDLHNIEFETFHPRWANPALNRAQFADDGSGSVSVSFFKPGLHSTKLYNVSLKETIFDHARPSHFRMREARKL